MRNLILLISLASLICISFIGIPFTLNAGQINQIGDQFHFITGSRSITALVANASNATLKCDGHEICVTPSDRKNFRANIPIKFEICESEKVTDLHCNGSLLVLQLSTSRWLKAGLFR